MEYSTDPNQNPPQYHDHYQQQQSAYDQSTAYYAYASQPQYATEQHQFYPPQGSYTQHQQPYPQFHQESGSIHPPGVPVQQNYYYQTQEPVEGQGVNPGSGSGSGGFNPAGSTAVMAVPPQVVNYSGNMDAVQMPKLPPQPAYKGRRGGRSFQGGGRGRGRGRGQLGHHGPRRDGRGSGRHFHHGAAPAIQNSTSVPSEDASSSVPASAPSQAPAALVQPSQSKARCELCNVDCNTSEVLEQHINGKKHKKKLLTHEQSQKLNKVVTEEQKVQPLPSSGSEPVQLEKVAECKEKQLQQNGLPPLNGTDGCIKEPEQQKDKEECSAASVEAPTDAKRKSSDQFESGGRGSKRKMRGGRGTKYMKTNQGPRRPVEPPKPKEVIPFICEICNVKCETLIVFNSHLSGKKHFTNLKKNGYGPGAGAGFQAPNPPNCGPSSSFSNPQVQQVLADPQAILAQLVTYVISQTQAQGLIPPQLPLPEALLASIQAPFASTEIPIQYAPYLQNQGSLTMLGNGSNNVAPIESESQLQSIMVNYETPQPAGTDIRADLPQGNSVMAPPENPAVQALEALPSTTSNKNDVSAPEEPAGDSPEKVPEEEMKEVTE